MSTSFTPEYTHDVLSDALVYADHASSRQGGTQISLEDVQLAVQSRVNYSFTTPPPKEVSIPYPFLQERSEFKAKECGSGSL